VALSFSRQSALLAEDNVDTITGGYHRSWDALRLANILSPTAAILDLAKVDWVALERTGEGHEALATQVETDREPDLTIEDFIRTQLLFPNRSAGVLDDRDHGVADRGVCALSLDSISAPKSHTVQVPGHQDEEKWTWIERAVSGRDGE
jgi:hypothetical protein